MITDIEKLHKWNEVCLSKGWSKKNELQMWLMQLGIRFTSAGSAVPDTLFVIDNKHNAEIQVRGVEGEHLATLVLEALTGTIIFNDLETEKTFWNVAIERFKEEFETDVPQEIIPNYITSSP